MEGITIMQHQHMIEQMEYIETQIKHPKSINIEQLEGIAIEYDLLVDEVDKYVEELLKTIEPRLSEVL